MASQPRERKPPPTTLQVILLPPFQPDLYRRAWTSVPHPTLPLIATTHERSVTVFSLATFSKHSALTSGHSRSVRCAAWKPDLPRGQLCLITGSFDATAGLWRWDQKDASRLETEVRGGLRTEGGGGDGSEDGSDVDKADDWEFTLVLEGHENEVKSVAFSPGGQFLATCGRDKQVWIWEDVSASEGDDEWETVAVLNEHDGDVKAVAWCPDVPGRVLGARNAHGPEVLASSSYDDTARIWREDGDGEWVCVAVLEGHKGTVWGVQWEPRPRLGNKFPRLLSWSADATVRIWSLRQEVEEEEKDQARLSGGLFSRLGGIPNTMRMSLREEWECTAILPKVHTRDIYSATWSAATGLVASTGSDGLIVVYGEDEAEERDPQPSSMTAHAAEKERDPQEGDNSLAHPASEAKPLPTASGSRASGDALKGSKLWRVLTTVPNGHGAYEINHITWCRRFDAGAATCGGKGIEEILVTTGDDGRVRPWQVLAQS